MCSRCALFNFGFCITECPNGRFGWSCKSSCPSGLYGRLCRSLCECDVSECHHVTGCTTTDGTFSPFLMVMVFFKKLFHDWMSIEYNWLIGHIFLPLWWISVYSLICWIALLNWCILKINENNNKLYWILNQLFLLRTL